MKGWGLALAVLSLTALAANELRAQVGTRPSASSVPAPGPEAVHLALSASPIFGADAAAGDGWLEIVARIENTGAMTAKGSLEAEAAGSAGYSPYTAGPTRFVARIPFCVQPHTSAVFRVPVRSLAYAVPGVLLTAMTDDGARAAEATVSLLAGIAPLLVDVAQPSRLSVLMRGWPVSPTWHPSWAPYAPTGTAMAVTVGSPTVDAGSGDALLPERAAGYAPATVVVIASDRLARTVESQRDALLGWVLAGGTIAVFPTRPEDLRIGVLTTLAGGVIQTTEPPGVMMTLSAASRASSPSFGAPRPPMAVPLPWPAAAPSVDAGAATPIEYFVPARMRPVPPTAVVGPSPALRAKLVGYSGGNLQPSAYGASAPYGLGQVHVLGFDPTTSPALEDGWTHNRLLDMVTEAWDGRALLVFPHGGGVQHTSNLYDVHRALDPNENFRPALGIATILLALYSIVAGPLVFMRAQRRGRPLEPLVWAPVASATCFALIVLVGLAGKGWSGRARHLSLVEARAGASRGSVRRFRGFFSSHTRTMRVRASEPDSVLDLVTTSSREQTDVVFRLDDSGASLENLTSLPWQTVVVSEDGFSDLGGGIAVRQEPNGSVIVSNHTGRSLRDVVVWAPKTDASWFPSIDDGKTIVSTAGRTIFVPSARSSGSAGSRVVHELDPSRFAAVLGGHTADAMATAWSAMVSASGSAIDWWPDDVPVVIGEIEGGEGATSDAGLRIETDRLLFRVVGEGGAR